MSAVSPHTVSAFRDELGGLSRRWEAARNFLGLSGAAIGCALMFPLFLLIGWLSGDKILEAALFASIALSWVIASCCIVGAGGWKLTLVWPPTFCRERDALVATLLADRTLQQSHLALCEQGDSNALALARCVSDVLEKRDREATPHGT